MGHLLKNFLCFGYERNKKKFFFNPVNLVFNAEASGIGSNNLGFRNIH